MRYDDSDEEDLELRDLEPLLDAGVEEERREKDRRELEALRKANANRAAGKSNGRLAPQKLREWQCPRCCPDSQDIRDWGGNGCTAERCMQVLEVWQCPHCAGAHLSVLARNSSKWKKFGCPRCYVGTRNSLPTPIKVVNVVKDDTLGHMPAGVPCCYGTGGCVGKGNTFHTTACQLLHGDSVARRTAIAPEAEEVARGVVEQTVEDRHEEHCRRLSEIVRSGSSVGPHEKAAAAKLAADEAEEEAAVARMVEEAVGRQLVEGAAAEAAARVKADEAAAAAAPAPAPAATPEATVGTKERVQVVHCDRCGKWRELTDVGVLPDKWFCELNADQKYKSCEVDEQEWFDDEVDD